MKNLLILILSIISIVGFGQTIIDPSVAPTTSKINTALSMAATASGTNTYATTITGATLTSGKAYTITFTNANSGTSTININDGSSNLGAITIKKFSSGSLADVTSGDISAGETKRIRYNGTYFVIEGGSGSSGGGTWGSITGTLSSQTDLQTALDAKQSTITFGTNVQSALGNTLNGASGLVAKDANQNISANNSTLGYTTTATAAGTTTLTVASTRQQYFTGTTTQTVVLPVVSTLPATGFTFEIINNSTGIVTVTSSGANTIQAMAAQSTLKVVCIALTGTSETSWSWTYLVANPMTTVGDLIIGGTVSGGTAAPQRLAAGTANYVLTSNGPGSAPSWNIAGGISGLTATRIPVATSSTVLGDYNGLKWDDASRTLTAGYTSSGNNILNLGSAGTGLNLNTSTGEYRIAAITSHFPTFWSNGGEAMRIASSTKNLLIGTTTDNSKLTVNGSFAAAYVAKTANYTLDATNYLVNCTSNSFTITLPTAVSITGRMYIIKNTGAGTITLATTSSQTIDGSAPGSLAAGPTVIRLMSDGANWITF